MKATTVKEAWNLADEIFPTDYSKNERASERGGYNIYESTLEGCNAWISDLGDRLEINLENGKTINIWIEAEEAPETTENTHTKESPAEREETPAERVENVLILSVAIHKGNIYERTVTRRETSLTLSHETTLKDIATFERQAAAFIKEARRATRQGHFVFVDLSKARYRFKGYADMKQEAFEFWNGYGDSITEEGVHLSPDPRYNDDPAHDMWITGKAGEIFDEMTV